AEVVVHHVAPDAVGGAHHGPLRVVGQRGGEGGHHSGGGGGGGAPRRAPRPVAPAPGSRVPRRGPRRPPATPRCSPRTRVGARSTRSAGSPTQSRATPRGAASPKADERRAAHGKIAFSRRSRRWCPCSRSTPDRSTSPSWTTRSAPTWP